MKCGHCKTEDVDVSHVRQCSGSGAVATAERGEGFFHVKQAPVDEPPATEAQRGYIAKLRGYKGLDELAFGGSKRQASVEIDRLRAMPDAATSPRKRNEAVPEGIYRRGGEIYKVQISHYGGSEGFAYAKHLVLVERGEDEMVAAHPEWTHKGDWERAVGMQYKLDDGERLSYDEAREFGSLYGFCVRCGRILEREDSIERGMGPKCAAKMEGE